MKEFLNYTHRRDDAKDKAAETSYLMSLRAQPTHIELIHKTDKDGQSV